MQRVILRLHSGAASSAPGIQGAAPVSRSPTRMVMKRRRGICRVAIHVAFACVQIGHSTGQNGVQAATRRDDRQNPPAPALGDKGQPHQ